MTINQFLISKKDVIQIALVTVCLLLFPAIGMKFTDEISWKLSDFVLAFVLLFTSGFLFKALTKTIHNPRLKVGLGILVFVGLLVVWISLI